jgi:branched-subunit amino acid transport protein
MTNKILAAIVLMAVVTYLPRVVPIAFFRRKLKSKFIRSFLYYVPFAVLGAMTFPSILYSTDQLQSALFGLGVALILAYLEKGLLKVALGAILAVYLFELWF